MRVNESELAALRAQLSVPPPPPAAPYRAPLFAAPLRAPPAAVLELAHERFDALAARDARWVQQQVRAQSRHPITI